MQKYSANSENKRVNKNYTKHKLKQERCDTEV